MQDPNKDKRWVTLNLHINDESLNLDFQTFTWQIKVAKDQQFRIFRVVQIGPNKFQPKGTYLFLKI